jgi:hypothetical protein
LKVEGPKRKKESTELKGAPRNAQHKDAITTQHRTTKNNNTEQQQNKK